ncbi:MAG: hypothetical protein JSR98_06705 [Proteobacteria bacterium]|nr:hypothetical protein [Pseudomonadota bacterium]
MITYAVQPILPLAVDGEAIGRVLHHAGVEKADRIWVTGPAGLAALLWMNRQGFRGASYVALDRLAGMRPSDAVLIPHACAPAEMAAALRKATCLREGGALVVQVAGELSADSLGDVPSAWSLWATESSGGSMKRAAPSASHDGKAARTSA